MKKEYNNLLKAQDAYEKSMQKIKEAIEDLEIEINEKVLFDNWRITYTSLEGYVIQDQGQSLSAPLYLCLDLIRNVGVLSKEDFIDLTVEL